MKVKGEGGGGERGIGGQDVGLESGGGWGIMAEQQWRMRGRGRGGVHRVTGWLIR